MTNAINENVIYKTVLNNCKHKAILLVKAEYDKTGILTDEIKAVLDIKLTGVGSYTDEEVSEVKVATSGPVASSITVRDYTKEGNPATGKDDTK